MNSNLRLNTVIFIKAYLGDTIVSLGPIIALLKKNKSQKNLVICFGSLSSTTSIEQILGPWTEIEKFIPMNASAGFLFNLFQLYKGLYKYRPFAVYDFNGPKSKFKSFIYRLFFTVLGSKSNYGFHGDYEKFSNGFYETHTDYLYRKLSLEDLNITKSVREQLPWLIQDKKYSELLAPIAKKKYIIIVALGTKVPINFWGVKKWTELLTRIASLSINNFFVFIGANADRKNADLIISNSDIDAINICGSTNVYELAGIIESGDFFFGHDSGPMHLAGMLQKKGIVIFSSRNHPGIWFPTSRSLHCLYTMIDCSGCGLIDNCEFNKLCINLITVETVYTAFCALASY